MERLRSVELFNLLGGFGTLLVVDVRDGAGFRKGHVPRAANVPWKPEWTHDKLPELDELVQQCAAADQRSFRTNLRRGGNVIVYGGAEASETSPEVLFAEAVSKGGGPKVAVLEGGFAAFEDAYPFLVCKYTETENAAAEACADNPSPLARRRLTLRSMHKHIPPFPWYPSEIVERKLYLGSHVDANNCDHLQRLGVTHVLNVSSEVGNQFPDKFVYHKVDLDDRETVSILRHLRELSAYIRGVLETPDHRIFVHCHQGVSRSGSVVLAFLMEHHNWSLKQAFDFAKGRRPQVFPNPGFWVQLSILEKSLPAGHDTLSQCIDRSVINAELAERDKKSMTLMEGGYKSSAALQLVAAEATATVVCKTWEELKQQFGSFVRLGDDALSCLDKRVKKTKASLVESTTALEGLKALVPKWLEAREKRRKTRANVRARRVKPRVMKTRQVVKKGRQAVKKTGVGKKKKKLQTPKLKGRGVRFTLY